MNFLVYDLALLGLFLTFLAIFLYRRRKTVKKEGLLLLYRTSWGIKLIHRIGEKYQKTLKVLSYISVSVGYLLMAGMLYLVGRIVWIYVFHGEIVRAIKIPPIVPLVPYLPQVFHLTFLPPFYFTYWIVIIAVIAIFHEFAHGIFAARSRVRIKNTGFGFFPFFLPIFLAAFVEPDEKQMARKKIFDQLAVLSAGTFANLLTAIATFGILVGFFALAFVPTGVSFTGYAANQINVSSINSVNGIAISNPSYVQVLNLVNGTGLNEIKTVQGDYATTKASLESQANASSLVLYYNSPAVRARLESIITGMDGQKVTSVEKLAQIMANHSPGDNLTITVIGNDSKEYNRTITLGQSPVNSSKAWLGVAFLKQGGNGFLSQFYNTLSSSFKRDNVYYSSRIGDMGTFIYNLLWWLMIIAISVALINMLPMGIFDGGKFFYLTVLAITKKEKVATVAYKAMTYLFLAVLAVIMFFWFLYIR